jgi:glycosyltransferase involved in cell wall biosynthesis
MRAVPAPINQSASSVNGRPGSLRGTAVVVGPLPPPYMGPAIGTEMVHGALEAAGAEAVHLNTQDRRRNESFVDQAGSFDLRNTWLALLHTAQLAVLLIRHSADIVYIPIAQNRLGYLRDAALMTIARLLGRDIVIHLRGSELQKFFESSSRPERWLLRRTLGWARMAIALTPQLRREFAGLVEPQRVAVLENAIVDPWPDGAERVHRGRAERAHGDPGAIRLLFIANLIADKGVRELIRALAAPGLERAELRIMGSPAPDDADEAQRLAARLGVSERISFLGECVGERKLAQFEWADVLVHPTHRDGQPIVLIEGMAAALPLVGSEVGGLPETIGETGIVVTAGDTSQLVAAVRRLIDDPDLRLELGERARRRYDAIYSVEPYRRRFCAVFSELLPSQD